MSKSLAEIQALYKEALVAKTKREQMLADQTRLIELAKKGTGGDVHDFSFVEIMAVKHKAAVEKFEAQNALMDLMIGIAPEITGAPARD